MFICCSVIFVHLISCRWWLLDGRTMLWKLSYMNIITCHELEATSMWDFWKQDFALRYMVKVTCIQSDNIYKSLIFMTQL